MRYVGGKTRIAKWIKEEITTKLDLTGIDIYIEPFLGSGATWVTLSPLFKSRNGSDLHEDLILMWQALQNGWDPPINITEDDYYKLKFSEPSALRGYVGFGASWGGKWFGGYTGEAYDSHSDYFTPPYIETARRSLLKVVPYLKGASLHHCSYNEWEVPDPEKTLIYCDPPYENTLKYKDEFDSSLFWKWASNESLNGTLIIVSESQCSDDSWVILGSRARKAMLRVAHGEENDVRTESLFIHKCNL